MSKSKRTGVALLCALAIASTLALAGCGSSGKLTVDSTGAEVNATMTEKASSMATSSFTMPKTQSVLVVDASIEEGSIEVIVAGENSGEVLIDETIDDVHSYAVDAEPGDYNVKIIASEATGTANVYGREF